MMLWWIVVEAYSRYEVSMSSDITTDPFGEAPILANKHHASPSVFTPESLLREARRQKNLRPHPVPAICILDPDGDLMDYLYAEGRAHQHEAWACYHTQLATFVDHGTEYGIIGRVVGASF